MVLVDHLQKIKGTVDSQYIYHNERDKACFQHGMAYRDFKGLTRRIASDKILRDKAFNIAKNPKYDNIKGVLRQWSIKFLIKKYLVDQSKIKLCLIKN